MSENWKKCTVMILPVKHFLHFEHFYNWCMLTPYSQAAMRLSVSSKRVECDNDSEAGKLTVAQHNSCTWFTFDLTYSELSL